MGMRRRGIASGLVFLALALVQVDTADADSCEFCEKYRNDRSEMSEDNLFRMDRVACIEDNDPATFDRNWCVSSAWFNSDLDFFARLEKCAPVDPRGRSAALEMFETLNCDSTSLDELSRFFGGTDDDAGQQAGLATAIVHDSEKIGEPFQFMRNMARGYYERGKGDGFQELTRFVAVLNRRGENGYAYLDNVAAAIDMYDGEVLGYDNLATQHMRMMCGLGVTFAQSDYAARYPCARNPKLFDKYN
ncbi:hypothetical protein [Celeribacter naphthalenivorans]|uniref:hypothetical protein n=1 Tax=Celeribacter naphthalenivorans TaxID=1614694 RepID=UPI001CFB6737|nr:hypothetical protein [Celeribacter naphthalenivorans]